MRPYKLIVEGDRDGFTRCMVLLDPGDDDSGIKIGVLPDSTPIISFEAWNGGFTLWPRLGPYERVRGCFRVDREGAGAIFDAVENLMALMGGDDVEIQRGADTLHSILMIFKNYGDEGEYMDEKEIVIENVNKKE